MPARTNEEIVKFLRAHFLSGLVPVRFVAVVMHDDQLIEPVANSQGHWLLDDGNAPQGSREIRQGRTTTVTSHEPCKAPLMFWIVTLTLVAVMVVLLQRRREPRAHDAVREHIRSPPGRQCHADRQVARHEAAVHAIRCS
jgi:hypothetical protein